MASERMAEEVCDVQSEVRNRLEQTNAKYKAVVGKHRCSNILEVGDLVMVFLFK